MLTPEEREELRERLRLAWEASKRDHWPPFGADKLPRADNVTPTRVRVNRGTPKTLEERLTKEDRELLAEMKIGL
jgi:hypothetical protein